MRIGEAAAASDVNVQTLRYYEGRQLVRPIGRDENGHRVYGEEVVARVRFIKRARELGFALSDVHEILQLKDEVHAVENARTVALAYLRDVERRVAFLEAVRRALGKCALCEDGSSPHCPLYEELAVANEVGDRQRGTDGS